MEVLENIYNQIKSVWSNELFHMGTAVFSIGSVIYLIVSLSLLIYLSGWFKRLLINKIFKRYNIEFGVAQSIAILVRYIIVTVGLLVIVQSTGIDLSALGFLLGALGIGIGFGLQSITNNFISGIIILFERPVKVGDRVEVGNVAGNIVRIAARATTIITNDNIAIIVPNSELINNRVVNWSHNNRDVRFNFPVGVAYKEDPEKIKKILIEVANEIEGVIKHPAPDVLFEGFGDSSLNFNLRVWTNLYSDKPKVLQSMLYFAIFEKFKEHQVEIPFPQRDVHIKSSSDHTE